MNFTDKELKDITMASLTRSLTNIYNCYEKIYGLDECEYEIISIEEVIIK